MYMLFSPVEWALSSLDLLSLPSEAQFKLFALVIVNLFLSWACEVWVFNWLSKWIESVWWYAKSRRREVDDRELNMDDSGPLDRKSWIKRTQWKEKGKWYKLIQDDLDRSR